MVMASSIRRLGAAILVSLMAVAGARPDGARAQDGQELLIKVKAAFLYNFAGYVTWPEERRQGPLALSILGESGVEPLLRATASKRKVNGRSLEVRVLDSVTPASAGHLLFVPAAACDSLAVTAARLAGQPVLIVADRPGAALRGEAAISFVMVKGKPKFEISRTMLAQAGLTASSHLLKLAILADPEGG